MFTIRSLVQFPPWRIVTVVIQYLLRQRNIFITGHEEVVSLHQSHIGRRLMPSSIVLLNTGRWWKIQSAVWYTSRRGYHFLIRWSRVGGRFSRPWGQMLHHTEPARRSTNTARPTSREGAVVSSTSTHRTTGLHFIGYCCVKTKPHLPRKVGTLQTHNNLIANRRVWCNPVPVSL